VISKYTDKMVAQTRMPVLNLKELQGTPVLIGETEFVHPDDEADQVNLKIYLAAPKFTAKFETDFEKHGANFMKDVRSYVSQFDRKILAEKAVKEGGVSFSLNDVKVDLKHKVHFFVDARDMMAKN